MRMMMTRIMIPRNCCFHFETHHYFAGLVSWVWPVVFVLYPIEKMPKN